MKLLLVNKSIDYYQLINNYNKLINKLIMRFFARKHKNFYMIIYFI